MSKLETAINELRRVSQEGATGEFRVKLSEGGIVSVYLDQKLI